MNKPIVDTQASQALQAEARRQLAASFKLSLSANSSLSYIARLATTPEDVQRAQTLRFEVYNLELGEGLQQSYSNRRDADEFDDVCDIIIAEDENTGEIVGTYRLQTGQNAGLHRGYYSSNEFDFAPYEPFRSELVELGRACVAKAHRNISVVQLLWRAIAFYARLHNTRYLIGCSSINSQEPRVGAATYAALFRSHLAPVEFRTLPLPSVACPLGEVAERADIPKLLTAYMALGARIGGPPAIDREFKTIDFLTIMDLKSVSKRALKYLQWPGESAT